ncbi:MAG: S9 family peptidase [Calditrichaeota bacterium]|nr:MAG: S9 family peptidase [Calditrichota bacterium]
MKRISWLIPPLILLLSLGQLFAQKKPFTLDDLYRLKGVGDVQISPDGKKIAFVVTEYFLHKGKRNSDIYVMDADGSNLRQLTRSEAADYHPRWSPDGKSLLFVSTRKEGPQAWLLPLEGGEPRQLTHFSMGVSNPTWTPDGKKIVFSTAVFPECGADDDCNKEIDQSMKEGPIQAHLADRLFYRHWNFWKDGKRTHTFVFDLENESLTDLTPGDYDAPSFSLGGGNGFAISPDGTELCYVSNHDSNEYETTNKDLWLVPLTGGPAVNLTDENEAYDGDPVYSPNGRYIAYRMQTIPTYESDRFRLAVYDRQKKETMVLTEDFDYWVEQIAWAPDSRSLYFTAEVKGHVPLFRVSLKERKVRQVVDLKTIDQFQISPNGRWLVLLRRSVGEPREVWRCNRNGEDVKRLTFFNKPIEDEVDIRPAEEMWIPSPTGKKIHTFIVKPHNFDPSKKYPLILNVHGGPQGMWADAFRGDWQVYPGAGYIVAFPNPHGSVGYGQDFTAAISRDWGGKVYQDVMAVADSLARLPYVDENRMGAMGWSYGGYMMMWLEGHTTRFKAIAAMMGVYDLTSFYGATEELWFPQWDLGGTPWDSPDYETWSPHKFAKQFKTPCLVITGEKDFRVSYTQSLEFFTALQKMGVPSRLIVFKNDGHWPNYVKSMPLYYNAHLDWFHRWLGGEPAPYDVKKMVRNQAYEEAEGTR